MDSTAPVNKSIEHVEGTRETVTTPGENVSITSTDTSESSVDSADPWAAPSRLADLPENLKGGPSRISETIVSVQYMRRSPMDALGVYFIPTTSSDSSPLVDFLARLSEKHETTPSAKWSLDHKLFRQVSPVTDDGVNGSTQKQTLKYMQVLDLSYHKDNYIVITKPAVAQEPPVPASETPAVSASASKPAVNIMAFQTADATSNYITMVTNKMKPLYSPRHPLSVRNGQAFEVGEFTVRVGELRQGVPGGNALVRGIVVEIGWSTDKDEEREAGDGEGVEMVKAFWNELGIANARQFVAGVDGDEEVEIELWCEALRLRN